MRIRGEESVAELCRREGLAPNLYDRWSKEFLEAGRCHRTSLWGTFAAR